MTTFETDYLVVGAGAVGLAFADTLLNHSDAHITIVDRHGKPGGHWNDAYSFVGLHQPSAYYGVASLPLGSGAKDTIGVNAGLYELATGHEVSGYFDRVMHQKLLPSGRVRYLPMTDWHGDGRCVSLLSGTQTTVKARRKTVDATYYGTTVPSTHKPKFTIADGMRVVPPNTLPHLWQSQAPPPRRFVILGAGKTAMDVGVWLLTSGVDPAAITWIVPRDSWLLNRRRTQPGMEFFHDTIGGQLAQMRALAEGTSADEIFLRMEAADIVMRIDPSVTPTMFHYATISKGEIEVLRRITSVVRMGRVSVIEPTRILMERGEYPTDSSTIQIDCTATAVERRPLVPIFNGDRITLQMVRVPQPAFSAALCAYVEIHGADDAAKNALCRPIPLPDTLEQFLPATLVNMTNQVAWGRDKPLTAWIRNCRLDGFGKVIAGVAPDDTEKLAVLSELRTWGIKASENLGRLLKR
jgi:hypothetical protein